MKKPAMLACLRKKRYPSEQRALLAKRRADAKYDTDVRAYYCCQCSGWHLTTQPRRNGG